MKETYQGFYRIKWRTFMVVHIDVNNIECKITDKLTIDQLALIQSACKFKVSNSEYIANNFRRGYGRRGNFEWDGYKKLFNIQTRRFPIGLLNRVISLLESNGFDIEMINNRKISDDIVRYEANTGAFNQRQYQKQAVLVSCLNGNGIVKVATGGGKTAIAGLTINELKKRTVFIVHTRDLLYQTIESFKKLFPYEDIGQIGDGVIKYRNITVATMQTLAILGGLDKNKNYEKKSTYDEDGNTDEKMLSPAQLAVAKFHDYAVTVQCVMMDEVQIVSSQTAFGVRFLFDHANYAFGYSASPWRDDGSDLMIEAAFGQRIIDITASELIRQGYLIKPTIEIHNTTYDIDKIEKSKYVELYKRYIVENDSRNTQICSDATKEWKNGNNVLILVTQIKHGQTLEEMLHVHNIPAIFISGKSGMKKRRQAIQDMRDGKISLMIASTIADVGLDIPRLSCIVEAGAGKSSVTALQRLGRIMRIFDNKDSCKFITYRDKCKYIKDHVELKKQIWLTEPEFDIKDESEVMLCSFNR